MKLKTIIYFAIASIVFSSCEPKPDPSTLSETGKLILTLEQAIGLKKDKAIEKMSHYIDEYGYYVVINKEREQTFEVGERAILIQERTISKNVNCIVFQEIIDISTPEKIQEFNEYYRTLSTQLSLYHTKVDFYSGDIYTIGIDSKTFWKYTEFYSYISNNLISVDFDDVQEQYFATKNRSTIISTTINSIYNPHIKEGTICLSIRVHHDMYPN